MRKMHTSPVFFFLNLLIILSLVLGGSVKEASASFTASNHQDASASNGSFNSADQAGQTWKQTGWFSIIWGDSQDGISDITYTLTDAQGQVTTLLLDEKLAGSIGGVLAINQQYISIEGVQISSDDQNGRTQNLVQVSAIEKTAAPLAPDRQKKDLASVIGSKPWVSIMCKFSDQAGEPKNLSFFQGMYADTKPGLDHYWRELSYDHVNVNGSTASGWFVLPHPESYYNPTDKGQGTDLNTLADDCIGAADASINFSIYSGINMMFNTDFDNGWAWGGGRYMSLDGVSRFWSTTWEPPWAYSDISVIAHEMGHGFGLPHSSGNYGQVYDNAWDVMSQDRFNCGAARDATYGCMAQHTISYHKDMLGWIPANQKFTAGIGTSTITLEQLALPQTANYKMAKILIDGSSTHYYTLEARNLTGYDVKVAGKAVVIHEVDTTRDRPARVIDMDNNGVTGDDGAMWRVGETFSGASGISVNVVTSTASGFQVSIYIPGHTISGNAGVASATLNFTDGLPQEVTADASGTYAFMVSQGWSGTVTPFKTGYTFSPTSRNYASVTADYTNQNYSASNVGAFPLTVNKSGTGTGTVTSSPDGINCGDTCTADFTASSSVILTAAAETDSTFTGWSGACSGTGTCTVSMTGTQTVTATFVNSICSPARTISRGEWHSNRNDAAGSTDVIDTYPIIPWNESGPEYVYSFTADTSGSIQVSLSSMTADLDIFVLDGGSGMCRASNAIAAGDRSASFTARSGHVYYFVVDGYNGATGHYTIFVPAASYTISGSAGVASATLTYEDGVTKTVTAAEDGTYSIQVPYLWSGTITPARQGYTFSPANRSYNLISGNQTGQNYATSAVTFTISGNAGTAGVILTYEDGVTKTVTADGSGSYSLQVSYNWSGTVTPVKDGYYFSPASKTYTLVRENHSGDHYTAVKEMYILFLPFLSRNLFSP
ncbi:MAG TPA: hypothetical protein PKW33_13390 [Anaerolineaceae bacterium]|nr:hypothetical protein [Anaerolineaceae bacterium]HPN52579.1 hypothetical protein [Anaerolineaceae bacterium]